MNEIIQNILTRRSVRSFSEQALERNKIELLIRCGLAAPSGRGKQTWKFTAILNQEKIKMLSQAIGKAIGKENYDMYNPTALIIPSNEIDSVWGADDNACALENIFLAAHSMGIGSVWINQLSPNFGNASSDKTIKKILKEFNIPENHVVYGIAALGYPNTPAVGEVEKRGTFEIIE